MTLFYRGVPYYIGPAGAGAARIDTQQREIERLKQDLAREREITAKQAQTIVSLNEKVAQKDMRATMYIGPSDFVIREFAYEQTFKRQVQLLAEANANLREANAKRIVAETSHDALKKRFANMEQLAGDHLRKRDESELALDALQKRFAKLEQIAGDYLAQRNAARKLADECREHSNSRRELLQSMTSRSRQLVEDFRALADSLKHFDGPRHREIQQRILGILFAFELPG